MSIDYKDSLANKNIFKVVGIFFFALFLSVFTFNNQAIATSGSSDLAVIWTDFDKKSVSTAIAVHDGDPASHSEVILTQDEIINKNENPNCSTGSCDILFQPQAIAVSNDGRVWVADGQMGVIYETDMFGSFLKPVLTDQPAQQAPLLPFFGLGEGVLPNPTLTTLGETTGMDFNNETGNLYYVDQENKAISFADVVTYTPTKLLDQVTNGLVTPMDIETMGTDQSGNEVFAFTDFGSKQLSVATTDGTQVGTSFSVIASESAINQKPFGLAYDEVLDELWVGDPSNKEVWRVNSDGTNQQIIFDEAFFIANTPTGSIEPMGLAVAEEELGVDLAAGLNKVDSVNGWDPRAGSITDIRDTFFNIFIDTSPQNNDPVGDPFNRNQLLWDVEIKSALGGPGPAPVPELPSGIMALVGLGILGGVAALRKKSKKK